MCEVNFSPASADDVREICEFIAIENVSAATVLLLEIEATCERLARQPGLGARRDDLLQGVRLFPVRKNYALFYRPLPGGIEIVRVIHAARDFSRLFET